MRKRLLTLAVNAVLIAAVVLHMVPIATMLLDSVRTNDDVQRALLALPDAITLANFASAWIDGNYAIAFLNTFIIDAGAVVVVLIVNTLDAYGLTKLPIIGRGFFLGYFVLAIAVPAFAIVVPIYFGFSALGLVNTKQGMILIYSAIFMPFTLLLMRSYFLGIPKDIEEAALIDGCTHFGVLLRITLPLAAPIITTAALIVFVNSYNEFLFANVMLQGQDTRTVALSFYNFVGEYSSDLATIFAAALIALAPIVILYFVLQRQFVEGMASGGLKG